MSENSTLNLSTTSHTSAANSLTSAPHSKNAALRDGQAGKLDQEKSRNLIEQAVSNLIDQLEQGHSETLTAYLRAMARFHTYSFGNVLEIARQKAVTYCYTSLESMNIGVCASFDTRDGRLVAV